MTYPLLKSLNDVLNTVSLQSPQSVALVCGSEALTYQELNDRSNQLAHYINDLNLAQNALIGVYMERSIEIVVAILGILRSGRAYVPLDPHYPQERIEFILQETQVSLVLTQADLHNQLAQLSTAPKLCLDTDWGAISFHASTPLATPPASDALAYVMYTSGSTGQPKGVKMPRANVMHYIVALSQVVPLQASDTYLHVASFSFSSSVRQLLLPLSAGATVVMATRDQTKNPLHLLDLMYQQEVTVFDGVISVWRYALQLIDNSAEQRLKASNLKLKYLILSGELTPALLLQNLRQLLGDQVQFVNLYGQTETIGVSAYRVPATFNRTQGYVPVGYSYPHNQNYILDANLNPVADGDVGELYVSGACLSQGYMNRPDLTAAKFIEQPWADGPPRIFGTGDLACRLPDGSLEIRGRIDFQVKVRGMRVELDEIAAVLEQHPDVKLAATAAHDSPTGEKVVVGYAIPRSEPIGEAQWHQQLREFVSEHLPDYMVPALFMTLEEMPKTPSGKLDRRNLPKPIVLEADSVPDLAANSPIQSIFCKAFHLPSVQPDDTFINLGGHSLLYVQFSIELERRLGHVPPNWEHMTVAELEQSKPQDNAKPFIETNILIRALAIIAIVAGHAQAVPGYYIQGGAVILLFVAGVNFARFQSNNLFQQRYRPILQAMSLSLIIPYVVVEAFFQAYTGNFTPSAFLLISNFFTPFTTGMLHPWFVSVYVQCIAIMMLLFSFRWVRRIAHKHLWIFSLAFFGMTVITAYVGPYFWDTESLMHFVPHMYMWLFLLGWTTFFAKGQMQKFVVTMIIVIVALMPMQMLAPSQIIWLLVAGSLIVWSKYLSLPRPLILPLEILGAASYYIYLTHIAFFSLPIRLGFPHPLMQTMVGLLGGLLCWFVVQQWQQVWQRQQGLLNAKLGQRLPDRVLRFFGTPGR